MHAKMMMILEDLTAAHPVLSFPASMVHSEREREWVAGRVALSDDDPPHVGRVVSTFSASDG